MLSYPLSTWAEAVETSMPTKNVIPSVKLLSKRPIPDIAESQRNERQSDSVSDDIRRPAGALGVTYIAPDFNEPSTLTSELFEGRD
jgi:hypothetical protein